MPIVDAEPQVFPSQGGLTFTQEPAAPEPSALDIGASLSREVTLAGAAYSRISNPDFGDSTEYPEFEPLDNIQGYEDFADDLAYAKSWAELNGKKSRIDQHRQDRDTLRRSGIGPGLELVAGLLDPSFLAAVAVPELALAKSAKFGGAITEAVRGAAQAGVYETGMHALDETRTVGESAFSIGGGLLLGGILGASLSSRTPRGELERLRKSLNDAQKSEVGAASALPETTLEGQSFAKGGDALTKAMSKIPLVRTDMDIVMASQSTAAKEALEAIADIPGILGKNIEGQATNPSVYNLTQRHVARVADYVRFEDKQWAIYKKRTPKDERLTRKQFSEEIAHAARSEDVSAIPEAQAAAQHLRSEGFDPLFNDAKKLKLFDEKPEHEVGVTFDEATGDVSATSESGTTFARRRAGRIQVTDTKTAPGSQGKGEGTARIEALAAEADARGMTLASDTKVSEAGAKVYDRLEKKGYTVKRNQSSKDESGNLVSDDGKPVFEVTGVPKNKGIDLKGDKSYFRRMWDQEKIRANRAQFEAMLRTHFGDAGDPEITAAVNDVISKLLNNDIGLSNWATKITVPEAGPLKGRTLDVPTSLAEPFLVNDPVRVLESYTRDLAPQVEMARRFDGDTEMQASLGAVQDEFAIKKEKINQSDLPEKEKSKLLNDLDAQEKAVSEALLRVRDRILNRAGVLPANEKMRAMAMRARGWRNWVASTKMGGVAMTGAMMDVAKNAATYGFMPTITKLTQLVRSKEFRSLSVAQARRTGAAVEVALARRAYDAFNGAMTDGWTQKMLHGVYKYSGLSHMTDFTRMLSGTLFEDRLIRSAKKLAEGKTLKKFDMAELAGLGFDEARLKRVAQQVEKHGGDVDGVWVSGSHLWDDAELANLYDSALFKQSHIVVQQPGAADRAWWLDTETGKLIGQLKTFGLSAPMRMTITPVQMFANDRALKGAMFVGYMMIGGYLTHVLRQTAAGKKPTTDPIKASQEAFTESGLGGILPDILSPISHQIGSALKESNPEAAEYFGGPVRYSDRNPISAVGGPALGAAYDSWDFLYNRLPQGSFTANDLHAFRRNFVPGQNIWWLRRGINALEGETADALDLEGATFETPAERAMGMQ